MKIMSESPSLIFIHQDAHFLILLFSMLVGFNVSQLSKWGYDNDTQFIDPLTPEFRPKNYDASLYTQEAIMNKIEWFWSTNAYNHGDVDGVYSALNEYSKTHDGVTATEAVSSQPTATQAP
jgi:hypothetical protein